jgi:hypothetical protein
MVVGFYIFACDRATKKNDAPRKPALALFPGFPNCGVIRLRQRRCSERRTRAILPSSGIPRTPTTIARQLTLLTRSLIVGKHTTAKPNKRQWRELVLLSLTPHLFRVHLRLPSNLSTKHPKSIYLVLSLFRSPADAATKPSLKKEART